MIKYVSGDIFQSDTQVIVNPVNCVGAMGKGLALAFKEKYPKMFLTYRAFCEKGLLSPGKLMYWRTYPGPSVLCFPTKKDWRDPSRLDYIESGLQKFVQTYKDKDIKSIAFPLLGCGLGGLKKTEVLPLMEKYLSPLDIDIYIYRD